MQKFNYENNYKNVALIAMIILGGFLVYSLLMFLEPFLGAIIFYILTKPLMLWLVEKKKINRNLSAIIVIVVSFLIIILPLLGISYMLVNKVSGLLFHSSEIVPFFQKIQAYILEKTKFNLLTDDTIATVKNAAAGAVSLILNQTLSIATDIGIMYFILFFMLTTNKRMEDRLIKYLPYNEENLQLFQKELVAQTYSNAIITPLLAIIQGGFASVGYLFFGIDEWLFWGMMTGVFSFMPLVGSTLVWVPLGIFQLSSGYTWQGIAIFVYSGLVITNVDNLIRFGLQKRFADVHPLTTLLGFLMGIKFFGLAGILFGPLLISFFLIMLKIFKNEFLETPRKHLANP